MEKGAARFVYNLFGINVFVTDATKPMPAGEPTLMGLDFFKRSIAHARPPCAAPGTSALHATHYAGNTGDYCGVFVL